MMASQMSWDTKVSFWNGGKPPPCSEAGTCSRLSICFAFFCAIAHSQVDAPKSTRPSRRGAFLRHVRLFPSFLDCEQQQQRDEQREDTECFRHREAEDQVAELALGSRGIAQRGCKVMAEDGADADAGAAHANAGNTSADIFCGDRVHVEAPFRVVGGGARGVGKGMKLGVNGPGEWHH